MKTKQLVLIAVSSIFIHIPNAMAYLDPVTGSFLIQGLVGGIAAVMVAFKNVRQKCLDFFRRIFQK